MQVHFLILYTVMYKYYCKINVIVTIPKLFHVLIVDGFITEYSPPLTCYHCIPLTIRYTYEFYV